MDEEQSDGLIEQCESNVVDERGILNIVPK